MTQNTSPTSWYKTRAKKQEQRPRLTPLESRFEPLCIRLERLMNHLHLLLSAAGGILLATFSLFTSWWHTVGLWGGIFLATFGLILSITRNVIHADLEKNIADLNTEKTEITRQKNQVISKLQGIFKDDENATYQVLSDAAESLYEELGIRSNATRLTLYFHDPMTESFTRIARVSDNPELASTGRPQYSSKQGFIAQVWRNSSAFVETMPKRRDVWLRHQVDQWGFTREEAEKLTMHARSMLGVRLDYRNKPVGVLIVESCEVDILQDATIDNLNTSSVCTHTLPRLFVASQIALGKTFQLVH